MLVPGSDTVEVDEKDLRALDMEGYIRLEPPAASAGEIHVTNKGRRP